MCRNIFADDFSGPGKAIGTVCMSVFCLSNMTTTFELSDVLTYIFGAMIPTDTIQVRLEGHGRRSKFTVTGENVARPVGATSSRASYED